MNPKRFGGNGSGKGFAHRTPLRPGWVLYHAGDPPPPENELPLILNTMLQQDLLEHPTIKVTAVLPITRDGNTSAIHFWYEDLLGTGPA